MTSNISAHYCSKHNRDDELEVAAVLLELPTLIIESNSALRRLPLSWGSKKRRSTDETSFLHSVPSSLPLPVPVPLPPVSSVMVSAIEPEMPTVKVEAASSPATPLSFSPSESDEKRKRSKRKLSVKKKKEEWIKIINKYTKSNESLTKEIENMRRDYDKLKAYNLWLQARKQQLNLGFSGEKPNIEAKSRNSLNLEAKLEMAVAKTSSCNHNHMVDQRLLIMGKRGNKDQNYPCGPYPYGQTLPLFPSTSGHGLSMSMSMNAIINDNNHVSGHPTGLPDLNASPGDSSFWMDINGVDDNNNKNKSLHKAITAAQARQRRMKICRDKNNTAATKLSFLNR